MNRLFGHLIGIAVCATLGVGTAAPSASARDLFDDAFVGWDELRVLSLEGNLNIFEVADLDRDGQDEVIFANERKGRLEIVRWLAPEERKERRESNRPNAFPLALDFDREEVRLDYLPNEVIAVNVDEDRDLELAVLVQSPPKILVLDRPAGAEEWKQIREHEITRSDVDSWQSLRVVPDSNPATLWISKREGLCELPLTENATGEWRKPREKTGRTAFWFADIDHDGDADLVEWDGRERGIRWHERLTGRWAPSRTVGNRNYTDMAPLYDADGAADLMALPKTPENTAQRLVLARGEATPIGNERALPIPEGVGSKWTSVAIGGKSALAYVDPEQPVLVLHVLEPNGWSEGTRYPIVGDVEELTAPLSSPGTILFRTKDSKRLHRSDWEKGRMSFPRPWSTREIADGDGEILGLASAGDITWWARSVKKDSKYGLELLKWTPENSEPKSTDYRELSSKEIDKAAWVGGDRMLFQEKFARSPKLATLEGDGSAKVSSPSALGKASIDSFLLVPRFDGRESRLELARAKDGVLQWLDDAFEPLDQVMLGEGRSIQNYVELPGGRRWALESGGKKLHRLEPDDSGVLRSTKSWELTRTGGLTYDRRLGALLTGKERVTAVSKGQPWTLEVKQSIDEGPGRPADLDEIGVHRVVTTDVISAPGDEVLLFDDVRRICRMFRQTEEGLRPVCSWPIYEDRSYPYGGESGDDRVREPKFVRGIDIDGDGERDLVMICHDRLLFYIARSTKTEKGSL